LSLSISLLAGCTKIDRPETDYTSAPADSFIDADIEAQTVCDNRNIQIKTVSLNMNAPEGPTLTFSGDNRSDADQVVTIRNCSVNNIMMEPKFEMDMYSGCVASGEAVFPDYLLQTAGIQTFSSISFILRITDASDNESYFDTDQFNMFTSMTGKYTQKYDFSGALIAERNGVTIKIGRIADAKAAFGKQIYVYIDNTTSIDIAVETVETMIDDIEIDPMFFVTVGAGKKSWAPLTFQDSDIIKNSIESIDNLTISLKVSGIYGTIIDTGACQVIFGQKST